MKWLKRSLRYLPDEFWEGAWRDYRANLELVGPKLPPDLVRLTSEFSLHDAKVDRIELNGDCDTHLTLVTVIDPDEFFELRLTYSDAFPWGADLSTIREWLTDSRTVIDRDEVDYENGHAQHRLLLWPEGEFYLSFADLKLESKSVAAERYQLHAPASSIAFAEPVSPSPLLEQYTTARLLVNRYANEGVRAGDVGWVVEIYGPGADASIYAPCWGYELEFMDRTGHTIALFGVRGHEVESAEPAERPT